MIDAIEFMNARSEMLKGSVHIPKSPSGIACVYLHGFPSSQHSSSGTDVCERLCKKGHLVMRFSFSGCDDSEGDFAFTTMSRQIEDIKYAIDYFKKNYDFNKLVLIGHSTGAINAALYSDRRIDKIVLMSGIADLEAVVNYDFTPRQIKDFWEQGFIIYDRPYKKWVHKQKLYKKFYDEFFTLDLKKAIKRIKKPLLIIHAEKDEHIPLWQPQQIRDLAPQAILTIIKGANHVFETRRAALAKRIDAFVRN